MTCVFCDILARDKKAHFIYEDEMCVAILDRYPVDRGHSLLIPREHVEKITDMAGELAGSLFSHVVPVAKAILRGTGADAFNVGQNNGMAARQIVPHVHIHIIPRYSSRGTNWTRREIASDDDLANLASIIRSSFE